MTRCSWPLHFPWEQRLVQFQIPGVTVTLCTIITVNNGGHVCVCVCARAYIQMKTFFSPSSKETSAGSLILVLLLKIFSSGSTFRSPVLTRGVRVSPVHSVDSTTGDRPPGGFNDSTLPPGSPGRGCLQTPPLPRFSGRGDTWNPEAHLAAFGLGCLAQATPSLKNNLQLVVGI